MMTPDDLDAILKRDVLDETEKRFPHLSKDQAASMALALGTFGAHSCNKERILMERGDTVFQNTVERYLSIIEANGFEHVLELPFTGYVYNDETPPSQETFYIYARRDGLLLVFDTHNEKNINGGHLYYNIKLKPALPRASLSSGRLVDGDAWVGDHDCREALIHNISRLQADGEFLMPWSHPQFLWLLHYMDTETPEYKAQRDYTKQRKHYEVINAERIAMLPEWVRKMIRAE
jgi:hypothetical protein